MRVDSWLAAFDHELAARGLDPVVRAELVVEAEGFLAEHPADDPLHHFGAPDHYATTVIEAMGTEPDRPPPLRTAGPAVVEASGITKSYRSTTVLSGVDLTIHPGEIAALVGPNGVGKTTLLRIVTGLERPDAGTVGLRGTIGYVPQSGGLDPYLTPKEHIELFGAARGLSPAAAWGEGERLATELGWNADGAPVAGELSMGTRQKLAVITAMVGHPDLLLLDEPYQGMDADSSRRFWELLWSWGEQGRAAVVSTHQADVLARAQVVIELEVPT